MTEQKSAPDASGAFHEFASTPARGTSKFSDENPNGTPTSSNVAGEDGMPPWADDRIFD